MKLIDLLVQELPKRGGWPVGAETLAQDISGRVYGYACNEVRQSGGMWISKSGNDMLGLWYVDVAMAEDWTESYITREQYEAALAASQQPAWDGTALPPVGCICEALAPSRQGGPWTWQRVKVVESGIAGAEKECLVYNIETTRPSWVDEFRPIRTEVERRREDLKSAIAELCRQSASNGHSADLIYDAIAAGKIPGVKLEADHE